MMHPVTLQPEDILSFIHHPIFEEDWKDLGLDDDDLAELQLCIMASPKAHGVIDGTGGVRIIEIVTDPRPDRGPIHVMVGYVFFEHRSIAALLAAEPAYGDAEITPEDRERLRELVEEVAREI